MSLAEIAQQDRGGEAALFFSLLQVPASAGKCRRDAEEETGEADESEGCGTDRRRDGETVRTEET